MKIYRFLFLGVLLCWSFHPLFSQVDSISRIRPFGFGFHVEQFKLIDTEDQNILPANKISIVISPTRSFRLEPEFGIQDGQK